MKERERDSRDEELLRLKAKLGEVTMANELLEQKIAALEGGRPLAAGGRGGEPGRLPGHGRAYGLARVARVWHLSRATVYRHRAPDDAAAPPRPVRRGPVGACSDAELLGHIRAEILGSRLHGEGYRKIWARLRHAGLRTAARRVRRLMRQHGLLALHRVGRPEQRAHDGTITTTAWT
jgi:hypothetical protein